MSEFVTIYCQRFIIENHGVQYPYFLGAYDARELVKVAEAPSFEKTTEHSNIAGEVLVPPTKHWQRPVIEEKIEFISQRFDVVGEIMPNPVLLAVNPLEKIEISQQVNANGVPSDLWSVKIAVPERGKEKPLWIIDGQHRLKGMAKTSLVQSPLPFVLLHSESNVYLPATLARIFAQVTTEATKLQTIHQAWMQFVFELGDYAKDSVKWRALKTSAILCSEQFFSNKPNPFYGNIQFNPEIPARNIHPNGFSFDVEYLQSLLEEWFFKYQGGQHQFSEKELAEEIALAVLALKAVITKEVSRSAFFGIEGEQKYFRDGFIAGVCQYLLTNGAPQDWVKILKELNFHNTPWDVTTWVNGTSGKAGNISKKIAFKCFSDIFRKGTLPSNVDNLCEYFSGKEAHLKIEYQLLNEDGDKIPRSTQVMEIELSGVEKITKNLPSNARHIKITSPCNNVGPVSMALADKPFDVRYHLDAFKRGRVFEKNELKSLKNKLVLRIKADLYGDNTLQKQLTITFDE
jgi:hypothetical protein